MIDKPNSSNIGVNFICLLNINKTVLFYVLIVCCSYCCIFINMSDNIRSNAPSCLLQVPSINGNPPPSSRRLAGIIPIRRHSTGSRHSGTLPAPRRPTRKSTITPPIGLTTVNSKL